MKRLVLLVAVFSLLFSALAVAEQDAYFNKNQITNIIVREFNDHFYVIVLLNTEINDLEGFYYYDFANLLEAVTFGDMFRRGRILGVQHYEEGSGHTMTWAGHRIAVITRFYCK